ncbi:MAG: carbohydrate kinase family protein [Pseudomonadota bacterium]
MRSAIACIGAAHIDRTAHALQDVKLGTSNPVRVDASFGGVARNVAENLARLHCDVALVSRIGRDDAGDQLLADLESLGIDVSGVCRSELEQTATYTALIDLSGELSVGMADMSIYDEVAPELFGAQLAPDLLSRPIWFLDTNLPAAGLDHLLENKPAGCLSAIDAVSVTKSQRLNGLLDRVDLLFANRDEAVALCGLPATAQIETSELANRLRAEGAGAVIVSMGDAGVFVASDSVYNHFDPLPSEVCDVTGAGDGMVSGILYGIAAGRRMDEAVRLGIACASLAIESDRSVNEDLREGVLLRRAGLL